MTVSLTSGSSKQDFLAALEKDAHTCVFGEDVDRLGTLLLPEMSDDVILAVAADCHILYGREVAEAIAQYLERKNVLPAKHFRNCVLMLHELLSNAVEYGSLNLADVRKKLSESTADMSHYYDLLAAKLGNPEENQKPVFLICTLVDEELYVKIKDQGEGFDIDQVSMDPHESHFGRGVYLVRKFARHSYYEDGGRTVVFTLPSKIMVYHDGTPNRLSVKKYGRVMLVEDGQKNLEIAHEAFKKAGYLHVTTAATGGDALAKAMTFQPDLILLNINLPDITGFAVCEQLKADSKTRDIPVLLTALGYRPEERAKGYRLGAVDFVNKPTETNELLARAEVHIMNNMMFKHAKNISLKFQDDIKQAREFQLQLLPQAEQLEVLCARHNVLLNYDYKPSENLGGDYWTVFDLDESHVALALADFTGHGVLAAMNTIRLHALLSQLKTRTLLEPELTARALNKRLFHAQESQGAQNYGMFATFLYVVVNTQTGEMTYAGCGAPGLFIVQEEKEPLLLSGAGLPLGLVSSEEYEPMVSHYSIKEGDTLLAFSDALVENMHHNGKRWLEKGLMDAIVEEQKEHAGMGTSHILSDVRERFYKSACQPLSDDLTLVSLTFSP